MSILNELSKRIFVVAEIGKNFIQAEEDRSVEEYLENAQKLVLSAKKAGADAVKFQTHNVEDEQMDIKVVSPHFTGADRYSWVRRNTCATPSDKFWKPLKQYCAEIGIVFFSTPMSRGSAQKLNEVGVDLWKVGSGDILDFVMLDYLASTQKPIIISSGMSTQDEVDKAIEFLKRRGVEIILLHCVSRYPCPPEELGLGAIDYLKDRYKIPVGFSDHSIGIKSALAAAALGACLIEKHFSLSRSFWGADHKVSIRPDEMRNLVKEIRSLEADPQKKYEYLEKEEVVTMLGKKEKLLRNGEEVFRPYFRKALVAGRDIFAGEKITPDMIYAMRPQVYIDGLPSEMYEEVIGRKAKKNFNKYSPIVL